ncbi:MAG: ligase-associated DNA damage response endonuclease PdeM [Luteibaculaceae bacterium]
MLQTTLLGYPALFLPKKALFFQTEKLLVVSDVHLGKANHFQKNGIPLPQDTERETLYNLGKLLAQHQPKTVLFLGDLFHSTYNDSVQIFADFMLNYPSIQFHLVKGNHDILKPNVYLEIGLTVTERHTLGPLLFTHEPLVTVEPNALNLCGHIHPAVRLKGKARQSLTLPCFWLHNSVLTLPAFGRFTGKYIVTPTKEDSVWVIANEKIVAFTPTET